MPFSWLSCISPLHPNLLYIWCVFNLLDNCTLFSVTLTIIFTQLLALHLFLSAHWQVLYSLGIPSVCSVIPRLCALHQGMFLRVVLGFVCLAMWFLFHFIFYFLSNKRVVCFGMSPMPSAERWCVAFADQLLGWPSRSSSAWPSHPSPQTLLGWPGALSASPPAEQIRYPLGKSCGSYYHNGESAGTTERVPHQWLESLFGDYVKKPL